MHPIPHTLRQGEVLDAKVEYTEKRGLRVPAVHWGRRELHVGYRTVGSEVGPGVCLVGKDALWSRPTGPEVNIFFSPPIHNADGRPVR